VNFKGGEDVLSHPQSMAFAKANGIKLPGYASGTITNAADRVHRDKQRVEDAKDALANAKRRHKGVAAAETRLEAAKKELRAAEIALRNAQRSAKTSIANTIATGLLKKLETGTSSAIASAIKSLATKLLNAGYNRTAASIQKKGTRLETLADKRASSQKTIAAGQPVRQPTRRREHQGLPVHQRHVGDGVGDLISQMTASRRPQPASCADEVPEGARCVEGSAAAARPTPVRAASSRRSSAQERHHRRHRQAQQADLVGREAGHVFGKDMADLMYDSGKDAGKGFLAGLKATEKALAKQMAKLATDLVKQIKKALKIKSPSGVFRDEVGKQVVLGMAHGIDLHSHLVGAATQRLADTATGVSMRRRYVPTAASGRSTAQDELWERLAAAIEEQGRRPQHLTGQLVLDSGELLGVIRGTVKPMVKRPSRTQAHRAKVGRRGAGDDLLWGVGRAGAAHGHRHPCPARPGRRPGQLAVLQVVSAHPDLNVPSTPSGWTAGGSFSGGGGTFGLNTGPTRLTFFVRELTGGDAAPTTAIPSGSSGSLIGARIFTLSRTAGTGWRWAVSFGEDTVSDTGFSAACSTALTWKAGDFGALAYAWNTQTASTTARAIHCDRHHLRHGRLPLREMPSPAATADRLTMAESSVTAGSGTQAPTMTATLSAAATGVGACCASGRPARTSTPSPQSVFPPRNLVSATGLTGDDITTVTLYRQNGTTLTPVRAASGIDVTGQACPLARRRRAALRRQS
jgi:hypothetical protein